MKSPYPYFGGKSRIADSVWKRFGDVRNYVEPFFGSGAVLLARPHADGVETVNDVDAYLCNFWRAVQSDADGVAKYCDWPVSELDLHSRHRWLGGQKEFVEKMRDDPDFYDAKIAGWWVWGISQWIGNGWCTDTNRRSMPSIGGPADGSGCAHGRGIHKGVFAAGPRPHLGRDQGTHASFRSISLLSYMRDLARRTRRVRVCCGDWSRVCSDSVTIFHGKTAVFLDPPYVSDDRDDVYNHDSRTVGHDCAKWAFERGGDPRYRIALCGYEGEYEIPAGWETLSWKAGGGFGNQSGNQNRSRERVWFSPHCLKDGMGLFDFDYQYASGG